jgi:hypothetical protein
MLLITILIFLANLVTKIKQNFPHTAFKIVVEFNFFVRVETDINNLNKDLFLHIS